MKRICPNKNKNTKVQHRQTNRHRQTNKSNETHLFRQGGLAHQMMNKQECKHQ